VNLATALDGEQIRIETSEFLTLIGQSFQSKQEVINALFELMLKGGYVKTSYLEAVLQREEKMPTGLQTQAYGIAIPHSDPEHVNCSAIAIALLDQTVLFKNMADPSADVPVQLVLLLAIAEKGSVTSVLARLAEAFLNPAIMNHLSAMKTARQLSGAMSDLIHGRLILEI
jgi:galactitol PTS system EIIA component